MAADNIPHCIIIGSGFAGLEAAKAFKNKPVKVTLIDKNNHHLFQPLLYQIATAGLSPADIAVPVRFILRKFKNISVLMDEVLDIDTSRKCIRLTDKDIEYDYLIVAAGSTHNYYGNDDWALLAPGLKTIAEATEIRRRILTAFETAEKCLDEKKEENTPVFAVIGGGATGVELAGAISELSKVSMRSDFRKINPLESRILLIEAGPRLLPNMDKKLSEKTRALLAGMGVEIYLNSPVSEITDNYVVAGDNKFLTKTVIWSAGIKASPLGEALGIAVEKNGKVIVNRDLSIPGHPEVFAAGDLASVKDDSGRFVPALAPAAVQEGAHAAGNIMRLIMGQKTKGFKYNDKGCMATIGRSAAVAEIKNLKISGFPAWITWLFIHIFFLIGFRNRFIVLFQWMWAYFTYHSYSRLITYPWKPWKPGLPDRQRDLFSDYSGKKG